MNKTGKGGFKKGKSGNPKGKKKGTVDFLTEFKAALKVVEKKKKKSLIQHAVEKAYESDTILVSLLRKMLPEVNILSDPDGNAIPIMVNGVILKQYPKQKGKDG